MNIFEAVLIAIVCFFVLILAAYPIYKFTRGDWKIERDPENGDFVLVERQKDGSYH